MVNLGRSFTYHGGSPWEIFPVFSNLIQVCLNAYSLLSFKVTHIFGPSSFAVMISLRSFSPIQDLGGKSFIDISLGVI